MSAAGFKVLLKAEMSCGLLLVFYIHVRVSHKSLKPELNSVSFWAGISLTYVDLSFSALSLSGGRATELDLLLCIPGFPVFGAVSVKWFWVRTGRMKVTLCCFMAHVAQSSQMVTWDGLLCVVVVCESKMPKKAGVNSVCILLCISHMLNLIYFTQLSSMFPYRLIENKHFWCWSEELKYSFFPLPYSDIWITSRKY